MKRPGTALIVAAAMAGLFAGAAQVSAQQPAQGVSSIGTVAHRSINDKHSCKGENSCKGQGGCKSGDNGCKGKNSCKGKGGCNTEGAAGLYS